MSDSRHGARTVSPAGRVVSDRAGTPPARPATPYDALPEESFDRVARLAAAALRSPVSIVSLVDDDRHIVKSSIGLTGRSRVWRKVPVAQRYVRQVVNTGRPVFIGNTSENRSHPDTESQAPDGVAYAVVPISTPDGQVIGTICVIDTAPHAWTHSEINGLIDVSSILMMELELRSDLTLKRQTQEHLLYSTLHDALTGLPNRSLFTERLRHAMRRAARHPDDLFAVLFLDLDRFKDINDNLGHFAGDELLRAVARRLEACIRPEDTVARLSGDEFAILLESITDTSDAGRVAERIEEALSFPINLAGAEVTT
ncbi:MAG TPA: diguanylate cyclase, partial [Gemmatimonadaceae bacterium]|nr:diguanylate cyclase [Gemmatimonadaceae bacterium]